MNIPHGESFGEIALKRPCTKVWTNHRETILDGAVVRVETQGNIHTTPEVPME